MKNKRIITPFRKKYSNFYRAELRRKYKLEAIEYKGGKCSICGYNKCPGALTFHHLDPSIKEFRISLKQSFKAMKSELDKCILLCNNCHAETHEEEYKRERDRKLEEIKLEKRSYKKKSNE